ncbi:MAG: hypothetical protein FJW23_06890 [Acidimicrobiia bacterium]|nr:hypothetical protein [Acidimicrobiia bacterium]
MGAFARLPEEFTIRSVTPTTGNGAARRGCRSRAAALVLAAAVFSVVPPGSVSAHTTGADLTWTELAVGDDPSHDFLGAVAVALDSHIYVVGGSHPDRLYRFNPGTNEWVRLPDAPFGVIDGGAATWGGRIFVVGNPADGRVQIYNPGLGTWALGAAIPSPTSGFAVVEAFGKVFALGGGGTALVRRYDPDTDTWLRRSDMPTARDHAGAAFIHNHVYALGGELNGAAVDAIEAYDPVTDVWAVPADASLPRPRRRRRRGRGTRGQHLRGGRPGRPGGRHLDRGRAHDQPLRLAPVRWASPRVVRQEPPGPDAVRCSGRALRRATVRHWRSQRRCRGGCCGTRGRVRGPLDRSGAAVHGRPARGPRHNHQGRTRDGAPDGHRRPARGARPARLRLDRPGAHRPRDGVPGRAPCRPVDRSAGGLHGFRPVAPAPHICHRQIHGHPRDARGPAQGGRRSPADAPALTVPAGGCPPVRPRRTAGT